MIIGSEGGGGELCGGAFEKLCFSMILAMESPVCPLVVLVVSVVMVAVLFFKQYTDEAVIHQLHFGQQLLPK
jgi:hypothetical protein